MQQFESELPDLVLLDVMLPEMNGFEATEAIRCEAERTGAARLPIIAMTANAMASDREACEAAGMDDFIAKPIQAQALYRTLEKFAFVS